VRGEDPHGGDHVAESVWGAAAAPRAFAHTLGACDTIEVKAEQFADLLRTC
jgi:hypothetical protein